MVPTLSSARSQRCRAPRTDGFLEGVGGALLVVTPAAIGTAYVWGCPCTACPLTRASIATESGQGQQVPRGPCLVTSWRCAPQETEVAWQLLHSG